MDRRMLPAMCVVVLLALPGAGAAKGPVRAPDEGPDPRGLTVAGTGFAYVAAPERPTRAAVERAVDAARGHAQRRAVAAAGARAVALAAAAGLTLGAAEAVTGRDPEAELGYAPWSPCPARGRCRAPLLTAATVTVTFATQQTSAAQTTGRAVVAARVGTAAVRPRDRRSSAAIRDALIAARIPADGAALAAARAEAARLAAAVGTRLGAVLAIAERPRPFDDLSVGSFGPGRFCGVVRRAVVRRDPRTGRRRVVRRVRERRCFVPGTVSSALRITYAAG